MGKEEAVTVTTFSPSVVQCLRHGREKRELSPDTGEPVYPREHCFNETINTSIPIRCSIVAPEGFVTRFGNVFSNTPKNPARPHAEFGNDK